MLIRRIIRLVIALCCSCLSQQPIGLGVGVELELELEPEVEDDGLKGW